VDETAAVEEKAIQTTPIATVPWIVTGHREVVAEEEDAAVPMVVPEEMPTPTTTAITCIAPTVGEAVVVGMREVFRCLKLQQKTLMPLMECVMRYVDG
jgi:hypothetical protein